MISQRRRKLNLPTRRRSLFVVRFLVLLAVLTCASILLFGGIAEAHGVATPAGAGAVEAHDVGPAASTERVGFLEISSATLSAALAFVPIDRISQCPDEDGDGLCCAQGACHAVGLLEVWAPSLTSEPSSHVPEHRPFPAWSLVEGMLRPPRS